MFNAYIKKIMPIPITEIKASKDGYKYAIYTYASVLNQDRGIQLKIIKRVHNNKRIKTFDGWYLKDGDITQKYAVMEFKNDKDNIG